MSKIGMMDMVNLSPDQQSRMLTEFLFQLTIGIRDIFLLEKPNIKQQLYAINEMHHCIFPFLSHLLFGHKTSYTTEVVMLNIIDTANIYDMRDQVAAAWSMASSYALSDRN